MKRIFLYLFMFLVAIGGVNALSTTNNEAYWTFDNVLTDATGNAHTLTNNGASLITGKINQAYNYDGTNDYMTTASIPEISKSLPFTVSLWFKADSTTTEQYFIGQNLASDNRLMMKLFSNKIGVGMYEGTYDYVETSFSDTSSFHHLVLVGNSGSYIGYLDGVSFTNNPMTIDGIGGESNFIVGSGASINRFFNGIIDEVSIWDKVLTSGEVAELYNSGNGLQYPYSVASFLTFDNITANNVTLVNNAFYNDTIEFQTFVLNESTNGLVNHSYSINGTTGVQFATNSLTGNFNLTQSDGNYNISFYAYNNETNVTSSNYSYIVDKINPTFTDPLNATEINSYIFNVSTITCNDTNLDYCNITIEGTEYDLLTTDSITLTINGNSSYNLSSGDLAGNTNTSTGYVFVNPYQYFYFQKSGSPVVNFTFGGVDFTDYAQFKVYNENISIGSNSLTWNKTGYATQTINFTVTNTSAINNTYNVTLATIFINIYDKDTGSFVTGTTTVEFISTIGLKTTTTNGTLEITNSLFLAETYTIVVTNPGYISENVYFTFTNIENVEINVYMTLNTSINAGIIPIRVLDNFGQPVQGAAVFAKQWFSASSSFVTTSQALTDISGKAQLNVLLNDKVYVLSASYESASVESIQQTFYTSNTESEIVLTLIPDITENQIYFLYNIIASATESFNEVTNTSTITFIWEDINNEGATGCINTYRSINGQTTRINSDCESAAVNTYIKSYVLNTSQDIVFRAEMLIDGKYYPIKSFVHNSEQNPATFLKTIGLDLMVVPILFILCIVVGIASKNIYVGTFLMMVASGLSLTIAPGILTSGVVAFCFVIGGIIMYGGTR